MEILKTRADKTKRRAALIAALSAFAIVALTALFSASGLTAKADNASDVGSGGGAIVIEDVTDGGNTVYGRFHQGGLWNEVDGKTYVLGGATYSITLPANAEKIYVAYDLDLNADVWGIRGDNEIDGVPYMLYDGSAGNNREYTDGSLSTGELYPISWEAIGTLSDGRKRFRVTVGVSGELLVYAELGGGGEAMSLNANQVVDCIDYRHPEPEADAYGRLMSGLLSTSDDGLRSYRVRVTFNDNFPASVPYSACSGIAGIWILRFDEKLSVGGDEAGEGESVEAEDIEQFLDDHTVTSVSLTSTLVRSYTMTFDIVEDGYYYYFTMDSLANSAIGLLSDDRVKIQTDPAYDIIGYTASGNPVTVNVESNVTEYSRKILEYAPDSDGDKVNAALYEQVSSAFANLTLAFRDGTDKDTLYKMYWEFVNGVYNRFTAAIASNKATSSIDVANADLIDAAFSSNNLADAVKSLGGDEAKLKITVAVMPSDSSVSAAVLAAAGCKGEVVRLSFTTELNGVALTDDGLNSAIELRIDFGSDSEYRLVRALDGEYANAPFLNGAGFMITSLDSASGELFLVRVSDPKKDLTALWIALGVVAFVALGAVCVIVLYKKGIIRKKPKTEVSEPEDGDDETQTRL